MLVKIVKSRTNSVSLYDAQSINVLANVEPGVTLLEIINGDKSEALPLKQGEAVVYLMSDAGKTVDTLRP